MDMSERISRISPTDRLFMKYPAVHLPPFYAKLAHSGAEIYQSKIKASFDLGQKIRLYNDNGFFALGEVRDFEKGLAIKPVKLFVL